jgi:hypothetical protein
VFAVASLAVSTDTRALLWFGKYMGWFLCVRYQLTIFNEVVTTVFHSWMVWSYSRAQAGTGEGLSFLRRQWAPSATWSSLATRLTVFHSQCCWRWAECLQAVEKLHRLSKLIVSLFGLMHRGINSSSQAERRKYSFPLNTWTCWEVLKGC